MKLFRRAAAWLPVGDVPEVTPEALQARIAETSRAPQLVDVRSGLEYRRGHIEGAVSLPILGFEKALPGLGLDPARPVVAICRTAHRSILAVRILRDAGFDALQLAGGMLAWWKADLPYVKE